MKFAFKVRLEWGPHKDPPQLQVPELLPVIDWGIMHPQSTAEWSMTHRLASPPTYVPVDARPYVTFNYPMHDAIGIGVNAGPDPGWILIGDPSTGAGSARVHYQLTQIALYRDGNVAAMCPPSPDPAVGTLYGSWAPAVPGTPSRQNKLMIGSRNPFDFTDDTATWNPWLSSNLPGYPCPDVTPAVSCVDFEGCALGWTIANGWQSAPNSDFRVAWWSNPDLPAGWTDSVPHPVVTVVAVQGFDRGVRVGSDHGTPYHAYVANSGGNTVSVVDLMTRSVIGTVVVGNQPLATALSPDAKRVYVGSASGDTFVAIDTGTNQRVGTALAGVARAASIAIMTNGTVAFVAHGAAPIVYAVDLHAWTATAIAVQYVAGFVALSPDGTKVYVLHPNDGFMTIIDAATHAIAHVLSVGSNTLACMVFDPASARAWVGGALTGVVSVWDTASDSYPPGQAYGHAELWGPALALSPDASRVYAAGANATALGIYDTSTDLSNPGIVNLPHLASLKLTADGSMLVAVNSANNTLLTLDPHSGQAVFPPIPTGGSGSTGVSLLACPTVTISLPPGSSSVDVTWAGAGTLTAVVVSTPPSPPVYAASGAVLHIDASALGVTPSTQGISYVRLSSNLDWTLVRVCATKPGGMSVADQQHLMSALHQNVALWQQTPMVLDAQHAYEVRVSWKADAQGLGELDGWSDSFSGTTVIPFTTALPPALGTVSDPNPPAQGESRPATATGLDDLSLYVIGTSPPTLTPPGRIPELMRPVFRGYDVGVAFGQPYVEQMYQNVGQDLDVLLFDHNNQLVRRAAGPLVIAQPNWSAPDDPVLTDAQATWIALFNGNTCSLPPIDVASASTSKTLSSAEGHVLAASSVYEARLVPQLLHRAHVTDAAWTGLTPGATDYRISVLVQIATTDVLAIRFRSANGTYYEFAIDPAQRTRTLSLVAPGFAKSKSIFASQTVHFVQQATILAQDRFVYHPGVDDPYRIHVEALGSTLLVAQNGDVVFAVTDATSTAGGVELHQPAGLTAFSDLGISDLRAGAPVAYRFSFTTSDYANFYHQVHAFQDRVWSRDLGSGLNPLLLAVSAPSGTLPIVPTTPAVSDGEHRGYQSIVTQALGSAAAQPASRLDVTRLTNGGTLLGWLVRGPEPMDPARVNVGLALSNRVLASPVVPSSVKITEAQIGEHESVTLLARDAVDLSGYRVQYRARPSAIADERGSQPLARASDGAVGDATWTDYRVTVILRTALPGSAGVRFRVNDANNAYAFVYDATTGVQRLLKIAGGVTTTLASVQGDPATALPNAPRVRLTVSAQGAQFKGYRDGKLVITASDATFTSGGAATWANDDPGVTFDSIEAHRLPNEAFAFYRGSASTANMTGWDAPPDTPGLSSLRLAQTPLINMILRARVRRTSGGTAGLVFRYSDPSNHYRVMFTDTERRVDRVAADVRTTLWSSPVPLAVKRFYEITVSASGSLFRIYQDGALVCELNDGAIQSGNVGICAAPGVAFDVPQIVVYPDSVAFTAWAQQHMYFQQAAIGPVPLSVQATPVTPVAPVVTRSRSFTVSSLTAAVPVASVMPVPAPAPVPAAPAPPPVPAAHATSTTAPTALQPATTLLPGDDYADVRVVATTLAAHAGVVGVVFGYRDGANFYQFAFDTTTSGCTLSRVVNNTPTTLWNGTFAADAVHAHAVTVDAIDGVVSVRLDGTRLVEWRADEAIHGRIGLLAVGDPAATYGSYRIGFPGWAEYTVFGSERAIDAGSRVRVDAAQGTLAPNRRTSVRVAAELDDAPLMRLVPDGARLRVVAPDGSAGHARDVVPDADFAPCAFGAARKADGTGIVIAPSTPVTPAQTARLIFDYERDNDVIALSEFGEKTDEVAFIDLPSLG